MTRRKCDSAERRFWGYVTVSDADGCWEWTGSKDKGGYGRIRVGDKKMLAHRFSWELANGAIPTGDGHHGVCVCHRCDNPGCCNPNHLFLGTQPENIQDMKRKGRVRYRSGSDHPESKLTPAQAMEIRSCPDISGAEFGRRFGVCRTTVLDIRNGKAWRHLP